MTDLSQLVREELSVPVDPLVTRMAAAIAARHSDASRAVLFYGSCLWLQKLDGLMLDFYLIVSDYRAAYGRGWQAFANQILPPNVYPFEQDGMIAKYAVLNEADFWRECGPDAATVSVWARFAQPSRLVWARDGQSADYAIACVARAAPALFTWTLPVAGSNADELTVWRRGFELTYDSELRAERGGRPDQIVDVDNERYRRFGSVARAAVNKTVSEDEAVAAWRGFRRRGKFLTLARLAKASTTFGGGIDYLAWKIGRHSGTKIMLKPWHRRWPLLAALVLLPRLLRQGAIR